MNESHDMHDTPRASGKDRLLELLADRALFGLDAAEEREVASLLREHPDVDAAGLERLAANEVADGLHSHRHAFQEV